MYPSVVFTYSQNCITVTTILEYFYRSNKKPIHWKALSHFLPPPSPTKSLAIICIFCPCGFTYSGQFCKWNHTVPNQSCCLSLSIVVFDVHPWCIMYQYFIPVCCWRISNTVFYFPSSHCLFSTRMVAFLTIRSPVKCSCFCCYSLFDYSQQRAYSQFFTGNAGIWLITLSPLTSYRYFKLIRHFGIYFFFTCVPWDILFNLIGLLGIDLI